LIDETLARALRLCELSTNRDHHYGMVMFRDDGRACDVVKTVATRHLRD
jgi:hypothetical protein